MWVKNLSVLVKDVGMDAVVIIHSSRSIVTVVFVSFCLSID